MELLRNPFFVLGASMRDDKHRIMELAEVKSLNSDEDEAEVRNARSVITNPRKRIAVEIGWLPGMTPEDIETAISILKNDPAEVQNLHRQEALAHANLLVDSFIRVSKTAMQINIADWIIQIANSHDHIKIHDTIAILNRERALAGFPTISDVDNVIDEIRKRRQYHRQCIKKMLDEFPDSTHVKIVTAVVDEATKDGNQQAPDLIYELVDSFALGKHEFLNREKENIQNLIKRLRSSVESGKNEKDIEDTVIHLEQTVRAWDIVAQPIQVSTRSRGTRHDISYEIAEEINNLIIELLKHRLLGTSKRLLLLQREVFAEIDQIVEQLEEDISALDRLESLIKNLEGDAMHKHASTTETIDETSAPWSNFGWGWVCLFAILLILGKCSS